MDARRCILFSHSFPIEWQQISRDNRRSISECRKLRKPQKKNFTTDWLVQGVLTRIGDMFDRLTGRGWKPSSSLATSELIERLKQLLDAEVREKGDHRKFVPHNIKLKMQWDKFSTDVGDSLQALEEELLTAAVDHINDKLYYTHAPISIEVKPDYFTSGVKLFVSYDKFSDEEHEAEMDVAIPGGNATELPAAEETARAVETASVRFIISGQERRKDLQFEEGARLSVGRTKENDLAIDDPSVSKMHASLLLDAQSRLFVADTGSTNGTFVDGERISYGKAIEVVKGGKLKFGTVEVEFEFIPKPAATPPELPKTEAYMVGEFEFTQKIEAEPAKTEASIVLPKPVFESEAGAIATGFLAPVKENTTAIAPGSDKTK